MNRHWPAVCGEQIAAEGTAGPDRSPFGSDKKGGTIEFATWAPGTLSVLRIMAALLFIQHGTEKFFDFPPSATPGSSLTTLPVGQGFLELVGGLLLLSGFYARTVAFILSGDMAVASFMRHAPKKLLSLGQRR